MPYSLYRSAVNHIAFHLYQTNNTVTNIRECYAKGILVKPDIVLNYLIQSSGKSYSYVVHFAIFSAPKNFAW